MCNFHFANRGQTESDGMSFLLAEENEDATLQEALAFIDAWDAPSITEGGASSGSKRRRGERQRIHDVRRRLRKKEEMLDLRQQAEQLEYQLAQLQHPDSLLRDVAMTPSSNYTDGDDTESNSSSSPSRREEASLGLVDKKRRTVTTSPREGRRWQMTAAAVRQERLEAELLNMTLRKAVASELKVTKALHNVLDKRPRQGVDLGADTSASSTPVSFKPTCTSCCNPTTLHVNPVAVRRELKLTVERMHTEANLAFNAAIGAPSLSFNFDVRLDPLSGPITALTTSTPLNCGIHRAMELLSPKVQIPIDPIGTRSIHGRRLCYDGASEKQFTVELGAPGKILILEGFGSVHKDYEDDRLLITWAAMSFDRCGALCFRECAWILATRSPSNPAQASVVRTHYTLAADKALGCTDIEGETIDQVRNRALRAIGVQIRDRHSKLQQNFLQKTGQEELAGFACS